MANAAIELFSVLCEIFGIILLGFIIFRAKFLRAADMKGFSWFTARIALPVMLFGSVSRMSTNFDFTIIVLVFLVKSLVSLLVYIPTLLIVRSPSRWLTAASYLAATSASNDAVFGFPLVTALYPQYMSVFVGILACNPFYQTLSIIAWEIGASKRDKFEKERDFSLLNAESGIGTNQVQTMTNQQPLWRKVITNLVQNPVVIMTILGMIYRFVPPFTWTLVSSNHKLQLPRGLNEIVNTISGAFSPMLLFQMGEVIEQNTSGLKKPGSLSVSVLLAAIKLIVTPALLLLLIKPVTGATGAELDSLQQFLVLYGLFPSSEAVIVFSKIYSFVTVESTSVLLITNLLSAPLMLFASVYLKQIPDDKWARAHNDMVFMMNWVSLAFLAFFFASFILMWRSWSKFPMINAFTLAILLLALIIVMQFNRNCDIALYAISGCLRRSIDVLLLAFSITFAVWKRRGLDLAKRIWPWLVGVALVLPLIVFLPIYASQTPRNSGPMEMCQRLFQGEDIANPILIGICLIGALIALSFSCGQHKSEEQMQIHRRVSEEIGIQGSAVMGEGVYLLVGVVGMTWLSQLVFCISNPHGSGGQFLIFLMGAAYNLLAITLCLLPAMRGKVLERWKEVLSSLTFRSQPSGKADVEEEEGAIQAEDVLALA